MTYTPSVSDYFAEKASQYDDVDNQQYWVFSDDLLWYLLKNLVLPESAATQFHLVDAGGGTARWSTRILKAYQQSTADIVDMSPEMLQVAKEKLRNEVINNRAYISEGDVRALNSVSADSADILICFHNVLGFFDDTHLALDTFYSKLKSGGTVALMFPSYYHAIYFSNSAGRISELQRISEDRKVKYNDLMPALKVFELEEIYNLLSDSGFQGICPYGFPLTLYPGMEETMIHGSTTSLDSILSNDAHRNQLFSVEKELCLNSTLAARGNNLLVIARKP